MLNSVRSIKFIIGCVLLMIFSCSNELVFGDKREVSKCLLFIGGLMINKSPVGNSFGRKLLNIEMSNFEPIDTEMFNFEQINTEMVNFERINAEISNFEQINKKVLK